MIKNQESTNRTAHTRYLFTPKFKVIKQNPSANKKLIDWEYSQPELDHIDLSGYGVDTGKWHSIWMFKLGSIDSKVHPFQQTNTCSKSIIKTL